MTRYRVTYRDIHTGRLRVTDVRAASRREAVAGAASQEATDITTWSFLHDVISVRKVAP